jgi:hypothetical protein
VLVHPGDHLGDRRRRRQRRWRELGDVHAAEGTPPAGAQLGRVPSTVVSGK